MERKIQILIRSILIILGILFMLYGGYEIYTNIQSQGIITDIINNKFEYTKYDLSSIMSFVIVIILGYILFIIGSSWSNIFKMIATMCISFGVLFLTLAMSIYPIYSNAEEVSNSVQPSIDYILAGSIDKILLQQIEISEGKKINLIYNNKTTEVTVGNIDKKNADLMWKELGFEEKISYETKNITLNLLLTLTINQVGEENLKMIPVPLNLVGQVIQNSNNTKDIKKIIEYDFFNRNITLRAENLAKLRLECENKQITLNELCTPILMTKYENIIKNVSDVQNPQVPLQFLPILKEIDTKVKMKNYIEDKTSIWISFTIIGILMFIVGSISYYLHFKLFNRDYNIIEIPYFISKVNIINYIPAYIIFMLGYFAIQGDKLITTLSQTIPKDMLFALELVMSSSIFSVFMIILKKMMIIMTIYFIISLILFIIFYFMVKKNKKVENSVQTPIN